MSIARPFIRLDASFFDDPKVMSISEGAQLFYIAALCKSAVLRSDGHLVRGHLMRLGFSDTEGRLAELLAVGLLTQTDAHDFVIPNFTAWQKSQADYAKERERSRDRRTTGGRPADDQKVTATRKEKTREEKKESTPTPPTLAVVVGGGAQEPPAQPAVIADALAEIRTALSGAK